MRKYVTITFDLFRHILTSWTLQEMYQQNLWYSTIIIICFGSLTVKHVIQLVVITRLQSYCTDFYRFVCDSVSHEPAVGQCQAGRWCPIIAIEFYRYLDLLIWPWWCMYCNLSWPTFSVPWCIEDRHRSQLRKPGL